VLEAANLPDEYLSLPGMLKATPATEGDNRYIYLEASNEARDFQGEVVMAKALQESAPYFERYGNLDIQHRSLIGLANGDPNYHLHEIGRPEMVKADGARTFVKGIIFSGDTPVAQTANDFWDSVTKLRPPQRWYPSVAGKITGSDYDVDPATGAKRRTITSVIWANIGFSRTPVNPKVPTVSTIPFGILAKCWGTAGLNMTKALEAGYGTDVATLTGGGALRRQSLDTGKPQTYWEFREKMSSAIRKGAAGKTSADFLSHARTSFGLDADEAGDWTERLMGEIADALAKEKHG
jgi:hypothetical protein